MCGAAPARIAGCARAADAADAAEVVVEVDPSGERRARSPRASSAPSRRRRARHRRRSRVGWTRGSATAVSASRPSSRIAASTVASAVRSRVAPAEPIASSRPLASKTSVGAMRLSRWSPGCGSPCAMSDSPRRLFSCVSKPGSQTPAPTPREWVSTQARPCASTATTFVVCSPPSGAARTRRRARARARVDVSPRGGEDAAGARAPPRGRRASRRGAPVLDEDRVAPERAVAREVVRTSTSRPPQERLGERAAIDARGSFLGSASSVWTRPGWSRTSPSPSMRPSRVKSPRAALEREEPAEHLERSARASRGSGTPGAPARARARRGASTAAAEALPELAECRGKPGHGARRRTDRVRDELVAERDRQLGELAAPAGLRRTRRGS